MTAVRRLTVAAVAAAGALAILPAAAASGPNDQQHAAALLERAARAAVTTSYVGVQYATVWTDDGATSMVADVRHTPGIGLVVHVRETPGTGDVRVVDPDDSATMTAPTDEEVRLLERHYRLTVEGHGRADGRDTDVVAVRRSDGSLAARFWLDRQTGLVLRREVVDSHGRLLRATAFVNLSLDPGKASAGPTSDDVEETPAGAKTMPTAWGTRIDPAGDHARLTRLGFRVPTSLPGGFVLFDARMGSGNVLHLSYSDGLSTVSVFEQKGRLDSARLVGWHRTKAGKATVWTSGGLPTRLSWSGRGTVYTVLADASPDAVKDVVAALPHGQHHPGLFARIGHGLKRILSWLNPFG